MNIILKHQIKMAVCLLWFIVWTLFLVTKSGMYQLAVMCLSPVILGIFIALVISVFREFKSNKFYAFIPLILFFILLITPLYLGTPIRNAIFMHKLPLYSAAVNRAMLAVETDEKYFKVHLNEEEKNFALDVRAVKSNNIMYVEFLVGGGFPVKHFGYVYSQSGNIEKNSIVYNEWSHIKPITQGWFEFGD